MPKKLRALWLLPAVILVLLDQWTKHLAVVNLKGEPRVLISGVLELNYSENTGAAFSMLQGKQTLLIVVTALFLGVLIWALLNGSWRHPLMQIAETLVIAGGAGNLIDRVWNDYVVDFIYVKAIDFPVFNVADCCVCCGAALMVVYLLFFERKSASGDKEAADDGGVDGGAAG